MTTFAEALRKASGLARPVRVLRNLRIDDVSSCDVGAGRGVRVVLTKRHDGARDGGGLSGVISAVNRAIVEGVRKREVDFSDALRTADGNEVRQAVGALETSINSILGDEDVRDKAAQIAESYGQFKNYVEKLGGERLPPGTAGDHDMSGSSRKMRCPSCGASHDESDFSKALPQHEAIAQAQENVFEGIVKGLMSGGASKRDATSIVGKGAPAGSAHYDAEKAITAAHLAERKMRLGY